MAILCKFENKNLGVEKRGNVSVLLLVRYATGRSVSMSSSGHVSYLNLQILDEISFDSEFSLEEMRIKN